MQLANQNNKNNDYHPMNKNMSSNSNYKIMVFWKEKKYKAVPTALDGCPSSGDKSTVC